MFLVGDKVKVKSSGAIGIVQEILSDAEVCVEFDACAGTRTHFRIEQLELVRPANDVSSNVEIIQADKGL
jgi:uncharacterized protein YodC (DUF2158 family)